MTGTFSTANEVVVFDPPAGAVGRYGFQQFLEMHVIPFTDTQYLRHSPPNADFTLSDTLFCAPDTVVIANNSGPNLACAPDTYQWTINQVDVCSVVEIKTS